ncbi:hypothetical protein IAR55_002127 [Kwoniella newhampshirensis]|uniref:WW domain-containing protein n=1 Tax=Kwoniella newhampshirensis TaxID=1651941 RepID=A0AAW0Z101_9TREE
MSSPIDRSAPDLKASTGVAQDDCSLSSSSTLPVAPSDRSPAISPQEIANNLSVWIDSGAKRRVYEHQVNKWFWFDPEARSTIKKQGLSEQELELWETREQECRRDGTRRQAEEARGRQPHKWPEEYQQWAALFKAGKRSLSEGTAKQVLEDRRNMDRCFHRRKQDRKEQVEFFL